MNSEVTRKSVPTLYGTIKRVPQVDNTLTKAGCYADAKAIGDVLREEQRAVNFSYDGNGNGLKAETIQDALDELNANNKVAAERIVNAEGRIGTAETRIGTAEADIGDIKTNIDDIEGNIGGINTDIGNIETDITNIKKNIDSIFTTKKPTGSYTGNGSATARTINVGGVGGWLGVCSGSYIIGIITQNGAMFFNTTNSTVKCFPVAQAKYMSGVLTLNSADDLLNKNGSTYHYQVL